MVDRVERFLERRFYNQPDLRKALSILYRQYVALGVMDSKFVVDFTDGRNDHFYPYLWEMLLARQLSECGYSLSSADEGPDFRIESQGRAIWVEAICPSFKGIGASWIAAIREKHAKLIGRVQATGLVKPGYLAKNIVGPHDCFVVALNISRLEKGASSLDQASLERALEQSDLVEGLQNPIYKEVSAVLVSTAGLDHVAGAKAASLLIDNPFALNRVPSDFLGVL